MENNSYLALIKYHIARYHSKNYGKEPVGPGHVAIYQPIPIINSDNLGIHGGYFNVDGDTSILYEVIVDDAISIISIYVKETKTDVKRLVGFYVAGSKHIKRRYEVVTRIKKILNRYPFYRYGVKITTTERDIEMITIDRTSLGFKGIFQNKYNESNIFQIVFDINEQCFYIEERIISNGNISEPIPPSIPNEEFVEMLIGFINEEPDNAIITEEENEETMNDINPVNIPEYTETTDCAPIVVPVRSSEDFIKLCKETVLNYTIEKLDKSDDISSTDIDVYVVWYSKSLQNHKALLSTNLTDGMYYELTYNGDKHELYFDAYKKWENKCIKLS